MNMRYLELTFQGSKKLAPPLSCNKPLPSPPIAQVINPNSPPKAQRTLVDAESGSPPEDEWPIIRPENASSTVEPDVQQQRSVSEGAAPQIIPHTYLTDRESTSTPVADADPTPNTNSSSVQKESLRYPQFLTMSESRVSSPVDSDSDAFHAISTDTDTPLDSPLAHKSSALVTVTIPPRISSKRTSLPSLAQDEPDSLTLSSSLDSRQARLSSTKWPVLDGTESQTAESFIKAAFLEDEQTATAVSTKSSLMHPQEADSEASQINKHCHAATTQHDSSKEEDANSSMVAESSSEDGQAKYHRSSTRVKRVSWRSNSSESGPVLTIFEDADAVLLGQDDSIPNVPTLPGRVTVNTTQGRSLSALRGCISKQVVSKITRSSASPSPTSGTVDSEANTTTSVKVDPIRSMQLPQKHNLEDTRSTAHSLGTSSSTGSEKAIKTLLTSPVAHDDVSSSSQPRTLLTPLLASAPEAVIANGSTTSEPTDSFGCTVKVRIASKGLSGY